MVGGMFASITGTCWRTAPPAARWIARSSTSRRPPPGAAFGVCGRPPLPVPARVSTRAR